MNNVLIYTRHEGDVYLYMEPEMTTLERKYVIMKDFLDKIGTALNDLNASDLWKYIQSIVAKLVALLKLEKEEEAAEIIGGIFKAE